MKLLQVETQYFIKRLYVDRWRHYQNFRNKFFSESFPEKYPPAREEKLREIITANCQRRRRTDWFNSQQTIIRRIGDVVFQELLSMATKQL